MKYKNKFEEYESVELARAIRKSRLKKGEMGIVVEIYNNGEAYEVEFIKPDGGTKALLTLTPNQIRPIAIEVDFTVVFNNPIETTTREASKLPQKLIVNTKTKNSNGKEEHYYPFTSL